MTDMPPPIDDPPIVIEGDRGKALLLLLGSGALVACGLLMVTTGRDWRPVAMGWASIAFFRAFAALFLIRFARPPKLTLDRDGVEWRGLRSWRLAWTEVAGVRVHRSDGGSFVAVERRPGPGGAHQRDRVILATLLVPPDGVASLLRERLAAAGAPVAADGPPSPLDAPSMPGRAVPWASLAIVAVLAAGFAAECLYPVAPGSGALDPSVATLSAFGGSSLALTVGEGQWFRVLLAPLLHASLGHLIGNAFALLWAGWTLERLLGRAWFLAVYAAGGLAGEATSLVVNAPGLVDVGASGAIMALFAATFALSFRFGGTAWASRLRGRAIYMLVPALFPAGHTTVNVAAHAGGAVAGALIGAALLRVWPRVAGRPPRRRLAAGAAGLCAAATLAAAWPAAASYAAAAGQAEAARLFRGGDLDGAGRAVGAVLARAPRDADAWNLAGSIALANGDAPAARANFDAAYRLAPVAAMLGLRGLAEVYAGDPEAARADLARAAAMDRTDLYPTIWLAIARGRAGGGAALEAADLAGAAPTWPLPVARTFAGLETPDMLRAEAARLGPDDICEADLYVAELDRAQGNGSAAREGFGRALRECPAAFTERAMAHLELGR